MRNRTCAPLAFLAACGFAALTAHAADKSAYTLFNPTPRDLMRDFATDRPDTTESAYTVDAGHVQVEMSLVEYTHDDDGGDFDEFSIAPSNIKVGLTNNIDLQLILEPYIHQKFEGDKADGYGGTQLRLKVNLWGNDGGDTAFAVMPFIKLPTADEGLGNDEVEGGIIIPFAAALPNDWSFGAMLEIDFLDDENGGRKTDFVTSFTFSHAIAGDLGGYVEFVSTAGTDTDWAATFNTGLTYGVTENFQLDAGVNLGLTRSAEDVTTFLGFSYRY